MPTESEKILIGLADQSFLPMWVFPNVYMKSPKSDGRNKEICDLLVIFGNDVIIFSDKHKKFNVEKDAKTAWDRWYREAVLESAKQVFGAEKKLFDQNVTIFADEKCENELNVSIPSRVSARIHRVLVARGSNEASAKFWGDLGSLALSKYPTGDPFVVHQPMPEKGCVHVIDSRVLEIILSHLDTLPDFISFLRAFEEHFFAKEDYFIPALEDCLARFIETTAKLENRFPDEITDQSHKQIILEEGMWHDFVSRNEYSIYRQEQFLSRRWDSFIERAHRDAVAGGSPERGIEPVTRFFASRLRIERRVLTSVIEDMILKTPQTPGKVSLRRNFIMVGGRGEEAITFLVVPNSVGSNQDEYLEVRGRLLWIQTIRLFTLFPGLSRVGMVAFNPIGEEGFSESFGLLERSEVSEEEFQYANKEALNLDVYQEPNIKFFTQPSFEPAKLIEQPIPRTKIERERYYESIGKLGLCPCGSGKIFGSCCWNEIVKE